jgi:hypothetical protein
MVLLVVCSCELQALAVNMADANRNSLRFTSSIGISLVVFLNIDRWNPIPKQKAPHV